MQALAEGTTRIVKSFFRHPAKVGLSISNFPDGCNESRECNEVERPDNAPLYPYGKPNKDIRVQYDGDLYATKSAEPNRTKTSFSPYFIERNNISSNGYYKMSHLITLFHSDKIKVMRLLLLKYHLATEVVLSKK